METTETIAVPDKPANLPRGWERVINNPSGFSIGLPPGWKDRPKGSATQLSAPGNLVVVSINADRTDEALGADLKELAELTLRSLPGLSVADGTEARGFDHRYRATVIDAKGKKGSARQRLRLIVMRPDSIAVYSMLAASSAKLKAKQVGKIIDRIARSLRHRPVAVG